MNPFTTFRAASLLLVVAAQASAALVNLPGLDTIRIWESTGPFVAYDFAAGGPEINARFGLGSLGPASNDFSTAASEDYDVFFSDANGVLDPQGDYVTVEAVFPVITPNPGGGGLNLGAVDLLDSSGNLIARADKLGSWYGRGSNYLVGSEQLAVDPADATTVSLPPTTDTTMGNTNPADGPLLGPLRVTVGFSSLCVPEPSSAVVALLAICSAGAVGMRSRLG